MASNRSKLFFFSFIAAGAAIVSIFQNCAPKNFDIEVRAPSSDVDRLGEGASHVVEMSAATREIPPLKLFFVVDNSYTMKVNQDHLAESFEAMFAGENATSLKSFNTEVFLINTAQRTIDTASETSMGWTQSLAMTNLLGVQKSTLDLESLSLSNLLFTDRGSILSGAVAGDTLGYSVQKSTEGALKYTFAPAPVLGFREANGVLKSSASIKKGANEDPSLLVADFKERLAILDASRDRRLFPSVSDNESGLCAMARIVRENQGLLNSGDISAFVLVSDENDADVSGANCLKSVTHHTGEMDLSNGWCEKRRTSFSYAKSQEKCRVKSVEKYSYRYYFDQTSIKYNRLNPNKCTIPQFRLEYYSRYFDRIKTKINFRLQQCETADGATQINCALVNAPEQKVIGDFTASCSEKALAINPKALNPTCVRVEETDSSCSLADSTCIKKWSVVRSGEYRDGAVPSDCNAFAASVGKEVDSAHSAICSVNSSPNRIQNSACSASNIANGGVATIESKDIKVNGLLDLVACEVAAKADGGSSFSSFVANSANCAQLSKANLATATKVEGHIPVLGLEVNQTIGSSSSPASCLSAVDAAVRAHVSSSYPTVPSGGVCKIIGSQGSESIQNISSGTVLVGGESLSCSQYAAKICSDSNGAKVQCSSSAFIDYANVNHTSVDAQLACNTKCNSSDFAKGVCGGLLEEGVNPEWTIGQYLVAKKGAISADVYYNGSTRYSCSAAVSGFEGAWVEKVATNHSCESIAGVPRYFKPNGGVYRSRELVKEPVTNDLAVTASEGDDLPAYIFKKTASLFGNQLPFVSVFVNQEGDNLGAGGSVGSAYSRLATIMGGQTHKVSLNDYSPAISQLSTEIRKRMERSFKIKDMIPGQKILRVWQKASGQSNYVELTSGKWTSSGNSVTISNEVPMSLGDSFKFEYQ